MQSPEQTHTDTDLELARMKLSLVEHDYARCTDYSHRYWERRNQLRSLEVTLISALAVVVYTRPSVPSLTVLCLYFVVFVFYLLDARIVVSMRLMTGIVLDIEKRLQVTEMAEFVHTLKNWTFASTYSIQTRPPLYRSLPSALLVKGLLLWHGGLAVAVTALLFATSIS
jgi:hypothetical protein